MAHHHPSALRILAFDASPSLSSLSVDRGRDRAVFVSIGLSLPIWRVIHPLSKIAGIQVVKRERQEGKPLYSVAIRVHAGAHIKFSCNSRDQAMHIMRSTARYLGLSHS